MPHALGAPRIPLTSPGAYHSLSWFAPSHIHCGLHALHSLRLRRRSTDRTSHTGPQSPITHASTSDLAGSGVRALRIRHRISLFGCHVITPLSLAQLRPRPLLQPHIPAPALQITAPFGSPTTARRELAISDARYRVGLVARRQIVDDLHLGPLAVLAARGVLLVLEMEVVRCARQDDKPGEQIP